MREGEDHPLQEELRDVHRRIDALKEESERHFSSLTDKLHGLEVAVAHGNRFPAAAWVAAAAIVLSTVGTGGVLYSELQVAKINASKSLALIEKHLEAAPTHRANVERLAEVVDGWRDVIPLHGERIRSLENKIVGQGPEGWHRRDHDTYAAMVAEQIKALDRRLETVERAQAAICERVRSCK